MDYLLILNIDQSFRMRITVVTLMRGSKVDIVFRQRIFDFVWVDTGRQTGDELVSLVGM